MFPVFLQQPSPVTEPLNSPAELECVAYGIPDLDYTWYRIGDTVVMVELDARVMERNGTLTIAMTTREDGGLYQCVASNDRGDVTSDPVMLTIIGMFWTLLCGDL